MLLPFLQFLHAFSPFFMDVSEISRDQCDRDASFKAEPALSTHLHLPLLPVMNLCNNQHPLQKRASLNKALLDACLWAWRWILRRQWKGASSLSKTKPVFNAYDLHSHEHLTRFTVEQNSLLGSGASNLHRMRLVTPTTAIILLNMLSCLEQYRVNGKCGDNDKHLTLKEVFNAEDVKIITD